MPKPHPTSDLILTMEGSGLESIGKLYLRGKQTSHEEKNCLNLPDPAELYLNTPYTMTKKKIY